MSTLTYTNLKGDVETVNVEYIKNENETIFFRDIDQDIELHVRYNVVSIITQENKFKPLGNIQ